MLLHGGSATRPTVDLFEGIGLIKQALRDLLIILKTVGPVLALCRDRRLLSNYAAWRKHQPYVKNVPFHPH